MNRDQRIALLLTTEERDRIQRAADKVGVGASTYIRIKVLEALPDVQKAARDAGKGNEL